jgi:hypothetical protein
MSRKDFWSWFVLLLSAGAYIPLGVGGWQHPSEINAASYGSWLILSAMLLYSSRSQGFAGWRMPLGFLIGNASLLVLGLLRECSTFNLGQAESIVLFGIIATLSIWVAVGGMTKTWNPRILFLGGIAADVFSFYPQLKQYLEPHEKPTEWMLLGWCMWILGAMINVAFVERLPTKLYARTTPPLLALEESGFSLENGFFMLVTVLVMAA